MSIIILGASIGLLIAEILNERSRSRAYKVALNQESENEQAKVHPVSNQE